MVMNVTAPTVVTMIIMTILVMIMIAVIVTTAGTGMIIWFGSLHWLDRFTRLVRFRILRPRYPVCYFDPSPRLRLIRRRRRTEGLGDVLQLFRLELLFEITVDRIRSI